MTPMEWATCAVVYISVINSIGRAGGGVIAAPGQEHMYTVFSRHACGHLQRWCWFDGCASYV